MLLLDAGETVTLNTFINRGRIYVELEQYGFALEVNLPATCKNEAPWIYTLDSKSSGQSFLILNVTVNEQ